MGLFGFFSKKEKPKQHSSFSSSIFELLGFYPNDESIYAVALEHRSVTRNKNAQSNNERLEFLGDRVVIVHHSSTDSRGTTEIPDERFFILSTVVDDRVVLVISL